jgi:hypothetical protein
MVNNPVFGKGVRTGKLDTAFLFKINAFLCLSEKEVSELVFPNVDGKLELTRLNQKTHGIKHLHKFSSN